VNCHRVAVHDEGKRRADVQVRRILKPADHDLVDCIRELPNRYLGSNLTRHITQPSIMGTSPISIDPSPSPFIVASPSSPWLPQLPVHRIVREFLGIERPPPFQHFLVLLAVSW
jgi:hypothetical protein